MNLPTLYRKVSVKDRKPEDDGVYFCFHEGGDLWSVELDHGNFTQRRITHWLEELPVDTTSARLPNDVEIEERLQDNFSEEDSVHSISIKLMEWLRAGSPKTKP